MRRLFPSSATGSELPSGSMTPRSMHGASIGSIRQEMFFGSKSVGSVERISCRKATASRARCRDGVLRTLPRIRFTGWVSHPRAKTPHGNWLWKCWRNARRLSAASDICHRNGYSVVSNVLAKSMVSLKQISDADINDDEAGEYQGDGKPGFLVRSS